MQKGRLQLIQTTFQIVTSRRHSGKTSAVHSTSKRSRMKPPRNSAAILFEAPQRYKRPGAKVNT